MTNSEITEKTIAFVRSALTNAEGGHDWFHTERVFKNALFIAKDEPKADPMVVALGALLHDIADSKFHDGNEELGPTMAGDFLRELGVDETLIAHVVNIIRNISFKGGNFNQEFRSLELDIVQDADRLDALGAIGIARCFNYGGFKNRPLYDPAIPPKLHMSKEEYKKSTNPSINHFYEKLLLLKDRMNTATGKQMAEQRHEFMKDFLEQFYEEWEGRR